MIRAGLQIPRFNYAGVADADLFARIATIATTAEGAGFDSIWVMDHFYGLGRGGAPPTEPMLEAYTLLGGIAARASRVKLGTLVTGVTYHNPAHLAKEVTTLDIISSGRAILGIGAAWYQLEHTGYGYDFPPIGERMNRLEEALQICRGMFTREETSFDGRYYRTERALNQPRPLQPGGPPILVGGQGETRLLRLVARYADIWNFATGLGLGEIPRKLGVLARHCEREGRDPATITKTGLRMLVIAPTQAAAESKGAALRARLAMDGAAWRDQVLCGAPATVAEQAQAYLDAGLDGLIVNLPIDVQDPEMVALAGEALAGVPARA